MSNARRHESFNCYIGLISAVYNYSFEHYQDASRYYTPGDAVYIEWVSYAKYHLWQHLERVTRLLNEDFIADRDQQKALDLVNGAAEIATKAFCKDRFNADIYHAQMIEYLKKARKEATFIKLTYKAERRPIINK